MCVWKEIPLSQSTIKTFNKPLQNQAMKTEHSFDFFHINITPVSSSHPFCRQKPNYAQKRHH